LHPTWLYLPLPHTHESAGQPFFGNSAIVHEASIALAIVEEVCERAAYEGVDRIDTVSVRIGALAGVVPDALTFAWELATEGTAAHGARLEIIRVPLSIECSVCNERRVVDHGTMPVCPVCATPSSCIVTGRELLVSAMEVPA
jgi:hydrogenase nickel incorporation protein HypA/HybF